MNNIQKIVITSSIILGVAIYIAIYITDNTGYASPSGYYLMYFLILPIILLVLLGLPSILLYKLLNRKKKLQSESIKTKEKGLYSIVKFILKICLIILIALVIYNFFNPAIEYVTHQKKEIKCDRKEPYKLSPEFERARSLRNQRIEESGVKLNYSFYNCINIQYKDLGEAYGMFEFDKNSTIDNLTIYVSPKYKIKDDLLLALLLQHEYVHLSEFITLLETGEKEDCLDSEVNARLGTIGFLIKLNKEEISSLDSRLTLYKNKPEYEDSYAILKEIYDTSYLAAKSNVYCGNKYINEEEVYSCIIQTSKQLIRQYLINNNTYEKACSL